MSFKIAVIGCGWISGACHGPAYVKYASSHPDVELTACCDVDHARVEGFRTQFGFSRSYSDYLELLDAEKPDVVCLNVPERLICEMGCQVMQRGYPILAEKPPGVTVQEIDRLVEVAKTTRVINQVAFNRRYTPLVVELKRMLSDQPVHHVDHQFYRIGRTRYEFTSTAIHAIDTLRFLLGSDYQAIRFNYRAFPELSRDAPVANFLLDCIFTSGVTATLSICPVTGVSVERTIIHAIDQTFFLSMNNGPDAPGCLQHYFKGQLLLELNGAEFNDSPDDYILSGFYAEDAAFFDAVRSFQQPRDDFASCRQSVEIMEHMRERKAEYPGS